MKQIFFPLLLCLSSILVAHAQQPSAQNADASIVQKTAFFFEGDVVNTTEYFKAEQKRVYRSSEIGITRILKGNLTNGTIQVVYKGPKTSSVKVDKTTGLLSYELPEDNGHGNSADNGVLLPSKQTIVFFCRQLPASYEAKPKALSTTSNAIVLELLGIGYDLPGNDKRFISDVGGVFTSKQAFLDYMAKKYQLIVPDDIQKKSSHSGKAVIDAHRQEVAIVKKELLAMKFAVDAAKRQLKCLDKIKRGVRSSC